MEFKDFFKLLSSNLDLGSNREERMRNLLSLVCEADPGFEGTEDDPVMTSSAASSPSTNSSPISRYSSPSIKTSAMQKRLTSTQSSLK